MYVGRTVDLKAREAAHKKSVRGFLKFIPWNESNPMTYYEARGMEETLIRYFCTLNRAVGDEKRIFNQIAGIRYGSDKYTDYMEAGKNFFTSNPWPKGGETFVGNCK